MKKYFLYELKKNWLIAVVITVFACVIYFTQVLTLNISDGHSDYYEYAPFWNSLIEVPIKMLTVLCVAVPVWMFSFKMRARQVDLHFSASLRREKIYLVKSLAGLLIMLVPFTVAYWLGFAATAIIDSDAMLTLYVPAYFLSVMLAILLFGVNAFVFTRANRVADGIIFIILYAFVVFLLVTLIGQCIAYKETTMAGRDIFDWIFNNWWTPRRPDYSYRFINGGFRWIFEKYGKESMYGEKVVYNLEWLIYLSAAIAGIAGWAGLFFSAKRDKTENIGLVSNTKFGYVTLIPYFLFMLVSLLNFERKTDYYYTAVVTTVALALYVIFRRTVRLKMSDWIALAAALTLGIIFAVVKYQMALDYADYLIYLKNN